MADNPLETDKNRQQRISERAYHLWQSEGELHGHDQEYWERAEELIGMEESAGSGQLPNPMTVPGNDPSRPPMVEEASIQENLGEFPDQTDQGEHLHTPSASASHEQEETMPLATPESVETGKTRKAGAATAVKPGTGRKVKDAASKDAAVEVDASRKPAKEGKAAAPAKAKSGKKG